MRKNEIINNLITDLMRQRNTLNSEICDINYNEPTFFEKKNIIEIMIRDIDMQLNNLIVSCEIIEE